MSHAVKNYDIAQVLGGIETVEAAQNIFRERMDAEHFARIGRIQTPAVLIKIANAVALCDPAAIYVNTGSDADVAWIRQHALEKGEEKALRMPQHTIHYDLKEEQGRIIDRTFYIVDADEKVSSLALKKLRDEALAEIKTRMAGIMRDKTMMIGFYMRGPVGAPVSNPALEISSSALWDT